jgi:hypothetical protein
LVWPLRSGKPHFGQLSTSNTWCRVHAAAIPNRHHNCHIPPDSARQRGQARVEVNNAHSRIAIGRNVCSSFTSKPVKSKAVPANRDRHIDSKVPGRMPVAVVNPAMLLGVNAIP